MTRQTKISTQMKFKIWLYRMGVISRLRVPSHEGRNSFVQHKATRGEVESEGSKLHIFNPKNHWMSF